MAIPTTTNAIVEFVIARLVQRDKKQTGVPWSLSARLLQLAGFAIRAR
jgi:hypothetical protein